MITLRRGPAVAEDAIALAIDLERRGIELRLGELDELRLAGNRTGFTALDAAAVRRHRSDLICIVAYVHFVPEVA